MKIRKHLAVVLCLLLMCTLSLPISSFAYSATPLRVDTNVGNVITKTEIIYVEDDEGNTIPVEITEIIRSDSSYSTKDLSPTATVGEKRYYNIKVSNGAMGLASYTGKALSAAAKRKAGKIVANAIAKKNRLTYYTWNKYCNMGYRWNTCLYNLSRKEWYCGKYNNAVLKNIYAKRGILYLWMVSKKHFCKNILGVDYE